ncbi:MAG: toxic anion resistance protein, partial [Casimicrobium sp.]
MSDAEPSKSTMTSVANGFQLTPPEVITPVVPEASKSAVPLAEATKTAVDEQVAKFVDALLSEDVESAAFKGKLDSAFALGREEISIASSLMQGRFMQQNFVGVESSPAYK